MVEHSTNMQSNDLETVHRAFIKRLGSDIDNSLVISSIRKAHKACALTMVLLRCYGAKL